MERNPIFFDQATEGDEMRSLTKKISRTDIVRFAGASVVYTPMHIDDVYAHRAGYERVFAMGRMSVGYLSHAVNDWLGDGNLRRLRVRFAERLYPGDTLKCKGVITRKYVADNENCVDCDVWVENQRGDKITVGWVTAVLPSRLSSATSPNQNSGR